MPIKNIVALVILCIVGCGDSDSKTVATETEPRKAKATKVDVTKNEHALVNAARSQIGVTTSYDPSYVGLKYPN